MIKEPSDLVSGKTSPESPDWTNEDEKSMQWKGDPSKSNSRVADHYSITAHRHIGP